MYFIRIMLLWYMLVISAKCSGSDEIPLDRAEQSSTYSDDIAAKAIDGDLATRSATTKKDRAWLRVYFTNSYNVERVVVKKGFIYSPDCTVMIVSVYDGEVETVCGTYTVGQRYESHLPESHFPKSHFP